MNKFNWWQYQQDCEDAFKLDCSAEDVKNDKEAKRVFKQLKKQRTRVYKMEKLYQKITGSDQGMWLNLLYTYRIKY